MSKILIIILTVIVFILGFLLVIPKQKQCNIGEGYSWYWLDEKTIIDSNGNRFRMPEFPINN